MSEPPQPMETDIIHTMHRYVLEGMRLQLGTGPQRVPGDFRAVKA